MHYRYYRPYYCRRYYGRYCIPYYYRRYYYPLYNEYYPDEYTNNDNEKDDKKDDIKPYPHPNNVQAINSNTEATPAPVIVPYDPNRQLPQ